MGGMTFTGAIERVNDIHDNQHVEVHNHYVSAVPDVREGQQGAAGATHPRRKKPKKSFAQLVCLPQYESDVMAKLHELMGRQTEPKGIMMPVRAAMDAGAIGRPTWDVFCGEFGKELVSSKALMIKYTSPDYAYEGAAFSKTVNVFREIITE